MKFSNQNDVKYNYKLFESQIYQDQWCGAITINQKNNFVLLGYKFAIKRFAFKNGVLHQANFIINHSDDVSSLNILTKKSHIISGSNDANIVIADTNLMANPKYLKKLKGHTDRIYCIVISPFNEEIIVSSSKDCTIKFWNISNYKTKKYCYQTITAHKKPVLKLSMNKQGNKLLSLGIDKVILIMIQQELFWVIQQKILLDQEGPNVCFLTDEIFIFQPRVFFPNQQKTENILIFMFEQNTQLYQLKKDIIISDTFQSCIGSFPCFYNDLRSLLILQNGCSLKMIRCNNIEQGEFKIEQFISLNKQEQISPLSYICATISNDWKYLLIWNKSSFIIQVRICYEFM